MMRAATTSRTAVCCVVLAVTLATSARAAELRFEHVLNIGLTGSGNGELSRFKDLAFGRDGRLLATDAAHGVVQVFDKTTGSLVARFGGAGGPDSHLDRPAGIAVDAEGNIFVANRAAAVKKYDSAYRWQLSFATHQREPGEAGTPQYMDVYDGRLYLTDAANHRVEAYDLRGRLLLSVGGRGAALGWFDTPQAVKIGRDGRLYVTDRMNDRIAVFDRDGKVIQGWGWTGSEPGELSAPAGLALDSENNVYVTDSGNDRVQVFDRYGCLVAMWGGRGSGDGEFADPHGIAVDPATGTVYVADTGNNRIQVFRRAATPNRQARMSDSRSR
jgi:DNA-binding beta-propeller fold protein YncE